jgi:hypothetical protein
MGLQADGFAEGCRHRIPVPGDTVELSPGEPPLQQCARRQRDQEYDGECVQCDIRE